MLEWIHGGERLQAVLSGGQRRRDRGDALDAARLARADERRTELYDIHRGVPLMSRALLAERLQQLERDGIVTKATGSGTKQKQHQWKLTPSGEALREVIDVMGRWGLIYGRDRVSAGDYDSTVLMWALRRRVDRQALPDRRVVVRFDLSGVARCRDQRSAALARSDPRSCRCLPERSRLSGRGGRIGRYRPARRRLSRLQVVAYGSAERSEGDGRP